MIKKKLLTLMFLCVSSFTFSQSISLSQTQLTINGAYNVSELVAEVDVTNKTNQIVNFKVARMENNLVTGTTNYFCWDLCYGSGVDTSGSLSINGLETFEGFSAHLEPDLNSGENTIDYVFYNAENPSDFVVFSVTFNIWGMNINASEKLVLDVYPTLIKNTFTVSSNGSFNSNLSLEIFDFTGKKIEEKEFLESLQKFNISNYNSGMYFIRIYNENELLLTQKIIKK